VSSKIARATQRNPVSKKKKKPTKKNRRLFRNQTKLTSQPELKFVEGGS
jgi:hypothetical protein